MKLVSTLITIILVQKNAAAAPVSLFDEFDDAVTSVKDSFGSLLGDVITDVKERIDCTIFAVDQLLLSKDHLEYKRRCDGYSDNISLGMTDLDTTESDYNPNNDSILSDDSDSNNNPDPNNDTNSSINDGIPIIIDKQISKSISTLNNTIISKLADTRSIHAQLESLRTSLKGETQRMDEINLYLQHKLDNISLDLKSKFIKTEYNGNGTSLDDIWTKLQALQEAQKVDNEKDAKVAEIEKVINEILTIVHNNTSETTSANDQLKIKDIINNLANDININSPSVLIKDSAINEPLKSDLSIENQLILPTATPSKVIDKELHINPTNTDNISNLDKSQLNARASDVFSNNDLTNLIRPKPLQRKENFELLPEPFNDTELNDPVLMPLVRTEEARKIINQNKYSQAIINKYFDNPNYVEEDPFAFNNDRGAAKHSFNINFQDDLNYYDDDYDDDFSSYGDHKGSL